MKKLSHIKKCVDCGEEYCVKSNFQKYCSECKRKRGNEACRNYRLRNLEKERERKRKYYRDNREARVEYSRKWFQNNKEKAGLRTKLWRRKKQREIVIKLGGKCVRCGFDKYPALHIHHKGYKKYSSDYIKKDFDLSKVELICANCHFIEHWNEKENY